MIKALKDKAYLGTVIVTVGVFSLSIFSYFLQVFLGRTLSISDYGTFNALLSLSYIVGVPSSVLMISTIKVVSEIKAEENYGKLGQLFVYFSFGISALGALMMLVFYVFRSPIATYLNISQQNYVFHFGVFLAISYILIAPSAFLQGLLRFKAFALFNILYAIVRLALPILLIGWGVSGVFWGLSFASVIGYIVGVLLLLKNFKSIPTFEIAPYLRKILLFSAPVLFVNLGMMILNNIDVIMVKKFFDATQAGYYASIVTVGKVILFGAGTVGVVMLPQISELYAKKEPYKKIFYKFLLMQLLLVVGGVAAFSLFPSFIISTMFGSSFQPAVEYVPLFSVFIGLYVIMNFFVVFFLAIEKTNVFLFQIPAVVSQFFLLNYYHDTLYQIIWVNLIVMLVLVLSLLTYFFTLRK